MFSGLKSRIFITAEFILRHESSPETCLKGRTFICHEGAKTGSPQIIGIHQQIDKSSNQSIIHCTLSIIHWFFLGRKTNAVGKLALLSKQI